MDNAIPLSGKQQSIVAIARSACERDRNRRTAQVPLRRRHEYRIDLCPDAGLHQGSRASSFIRSPNPKSVSAACRRRWKEVVTPCYKPPAMPVRSEKALPFLGNVGGVPSD
jgi:hypothetical protein